MPDLLQAPPGVPKAGQGESCPEKGAGLRANPHLLTTTPLTGRGASSRPVTGADRDVLCVEGLKEGTRSERDGIDIGRTTRRRILVNAGLSSPRRRRQPRHRVRRQRMPREGMLIQMDGSHHPWLGDRAPPFTLLIAVDDATGTVDNALFCEKEDA